MNYIYEQCNNIYELWKNVDTICLGPQLNSCLLLNLLLLYSWVKTTYIVCFYEHLKY